MLCYLLLNGSTVNGAGLLLFYSMSLFYMQKNPNKTWPVSYSYGSYMVWTYLTYIYFSMWDNNRAQGEVYKYIHTWSPCWVTSSPHLHVFRLWEEPGEPGGNPQRYGGIYKCLQKTSRLQTCRITSVCYCKLWDFQIFSSEHLQFHDN